MCTSGVAYLGPDLVALRVFRWAPTQNGQSPIPLRGQVSDGFGRESSLAPRVALLNAQCSGPRPPRGPHREVAGVC